MRLDLTALSVAVLTAASLAAQAPPQVAPAPAAPSAAPGQPGAAPVPEAPPTEAEKTLDDAIAKLKAVQSISTSIREDVDVLGQKFTVEGEYRKAPGNRVFLDLRVIDPTLRNPQQQSRMQQICDGATLWDITKILDSTSYQRLDLAKVLQRLNTPDFDEEARTFFFDQRVGMSGPEALLQGLRQTLTFDSQEEGTHEGRPTWVLKGRWKDMSMLGVGNPPAQGQPGTPPFAGLPGYVPSLATVILDKETGWPFQVSLQGKPRSNLSEQRKIEIGPDGRLSGRLDPPTKEPLSRLVLTYSNVQINPTIPPAEFAFEPVVDRQRIQDVTNERLTELDQIAQVLNAQKKAEAARKAAEEPTIGTLNIPRPTAPPIPGAEPATKPGN